MKIFFSFYLKPFKIFKYYKTINWGFSYAAHLMIIIIVLIFFLQCHWHWSCMSSLFVLKRENKKQNDINIILNYRTTSFHFDWFLIVSIDAHWHAISMCEIINKSNTKTKDLILNQINEQFVHMWGGGGQILFALHVMPNSKRVLIFRGLNRIF